MRIDDLNRIPVTPGAEKTEQSAQQRPPEKTAVSTSDHAEVSHLAQALATKDPGRIQELRLEVQAGTYDVSAQAVASAIIQAHLTE
jgi:anti-sigma28 factor (negative regulator of flagellin synthesis)